MEHVAEKAKRTGAQIKRRSQFLSSTNELLSVRPNSSLCIAILTSCGTVKGETKNILVRAALCPNERNKRRLRAEAMFIFRSQLARGPINSSGPHRSHHIPRGVARCQTTSLSQIVARSPGLGLKRKWLWLNLEKKKIKT